MNRTILFTKTTLCVALAVCAFLLAAPVLRSESSGWDHYQNAMKLQDAGNTKDAIAQLKKALKIEPNNAFYHNAIGLSYIDAGEIDSAIESLNAALKINPNLPEAYSGLGVCYNSIGKFEKSIEYFRKAAEMVPSTSEDIAVFLNNIGQNLYLLKRLDEAEKTLLQAVAKNNKLLTAFINLGNVYTEKGDFQSAVANHKRAVELAPKYPLSRNNLAFAYFKLGKIDEAITEMQMAVEISPDNKQFSDNLEFLKKEQKRKNESAYEDGALAGLPREVRLKPNGNKSASETSPETTKTQEPAKVETATPQAKKETTIAHAEKAPEKKETAVETAPQKKAEPEHKEPHKETKVAKAPEAEYKPKERAREEKQPAKAPEAAAKTSVHDEPQETTAPAIKEPAKKETITEEKLAEMHGTAAAKTPPSTEREVQVGTPYEVKERKRGALYSDEKKARAEAEEEAFKPMMADNHYKAAKYNLRTGNYETAMNDIQKARNINPYSKDYELVEAMIKEKMGLVHEAAADYENLIERDPFNSVAINSLGHANEVLGRKDVALEQYMKAVHTDPNNGCASGNLGSQLAFDGKCDRAIELLSEASAKNCDTAATLNNLAFCYFKKGDVMNAQQLAYRAVQKAPTDTTILSNFSLIAEKSNYNYTPIKVSRDTQFDPFYKLRDSQTDTPLASLTPVEVIDFYEAFKNVYKPRKIVVVPFTNQRGTERWTPTPSQVKTNRLVNKLKESGYLDVVVADQRFADTPYSDKSQESAVSNIIARHDADMMIVADMGAPMIADRQESLFFGVKKKNFVEATLPVNTKIAATEGVRLIDGPIEGKASAKNIDSFRIGYADMKKVKEDAFDSYCEKVNTLILDHFNLVRYPVRKNIVKFLKSKPLTPVSIAR